ncbi:hypothetical protein BVY01_03530 [bacterium I07]|nr:hypothetical protein BVY01_03530 [bacterium I07]
MKVCENPHYEDTKNVRVRKAIFQINKNIGESKMEGFTKQKFPNHPFLKSKIGVKNGLTSYLGTNLAHNKQWFTPG